MQDRRPWSDADAHESTATLRRLCGRLADGTPHTGDISEWARLTLNVSFDDLNGREEGDAIDCDALVTRYGIFWEALAQRPRVADIVSGQQWPPSVTDVATLFDGIAIPGGIVDVGQGDPMLDLPASLDRRLRRRDLLRARGPSTVDPAFPDPLPRWKRVLFSIACANDDDSDGHAFQRGRHGDYRGSYGKCGGRGEREDSGGGDDDDKKDDAHRGCQERRDLRGDALDGFFIMVAPPSPEPDEDEEEYDAYVDLYRVAADGNAHPIAAGIIEWNEADNWTAVGRGDVFNPDRAEAAVGDLAWLLPAFLRRLAKGLGSRGNDGLDAAFSDATYAHGDTTPCDEAQQDDFDCTPGWVAGADEVRGALVQIGSIGGLPEGIVAHEPGLEPPVFALWMDHDQLRLAMSLFAGQRAAKTARAIADADAARSLEGAAAAIYRGPAFGGLLPEGVAHRLAFHRWVRGCAGARDRPLYEEALWHWPEQSAGDLSVQLDIEPDARVDPRRTSCGAEAVDDILAAAESLGVVPSAAEAQRPRLLCAPLARDAVRAGAWAAFGVRPFEPEAAAPYADHAGLAAQRGPWRRACMGTATPQDVADLVASALDVGLALEKEDLADPGRLCARLALFMAV
ncbi:hypothetical protein pneo_cds_175 [Pandoravirus neocaledonia]|uniref:Uncharacterized protein n=1 Tax=Pandoravirus neocaledonia TaxID=2107708 RepID=A0A2U7UBL7_9VIRU|nr:hypothetical protein pneo_cds_175 [Pandoravirus neocaledonia]AVK75782.1 hypothetical protein pneo_cds_175 [Pandoravirus neocaledonia]